MPGTRSADPPLDAAVFDRLESLPAAVPPLFGATRSFFTSRPWWEIVLAHALPPTALPRLVMIHAGGVPRALFPMLLDTADGEHRSLTTPYSCLYEPLFVPDAAGRVTDRAPVFAAFARSCRGFPVTRLDTLDQALAPEIAAGCRAAGLAVARFDHFGNWHEDVTGLDWPAYLARRPGATRETIRRRTRRAERLDGAVFRLFTGPDGLEEGIAAFETIYARSWKQPEPYPLINPAQIRAAAGLGVLRLGVWWIGGTPAAAQFWIVEHGQATVLKLAHDEAFKAHSPGTVVTAWMIRHMFEHEHIAALDFGRGDDPYKKDWTSSRRQRIGLLLINPLRPRGAAALVRHALGRARARFRPPG